MSPYSPFAFDAENKMTAANKSGTAASYAYDPLLRRQGKSVNGTTTTFLLDGAEEIGDYDGAGAMLRRFVPSTATDRPIAMVEGTGGGTMRKWFHRNRLGSTIAMSDGAGAVSEGPVTYDAFGNSASMGGVPFKYTGRRYDEETGLYYYRARYYAPALGRFLQTDPIGTCDDMNLYAYVDNDPVNKTDPTGLFDNQVVCDAHGNCSVTVTGERPKPDVPTNRGGHSVYSVDFGMLAVISGSGHGGSNDGPIATMTETGCDARGFCSHVTATARRLPKPALTSPGVPGGGGGGRRQGDRSVGSCLDWCITEHPEVSEIVRNYGEFFWGKPGPEVDPLGPIKRSLRLPFLLWASALVDGAILGCTAQCVEGGDGP